MAALMGSKLLLLWRPAAMAWPLGSDRRADRLWRSAIDQAGQLAEAEAYYRKILAIDQNHFDSLHLLGVIAHQVGRSDLAVDLIGKAIALNDRIPAFHNNMGLVSHALGRGEDAVVRYKPAAAHSKAVAHSNLSIALMAVGDPAQALKAIQRSIQIEETENTKLLFVQCVGSLTLFRPELISATILSDPCPSLGGRPSDLARFVANLLKLDGATGVCIRRVNSAWPRRLPPQEIFSPAELAEICGDRLLRCLLEATTIFDIELERFLTAARQTMLETASAGSTSQQVGEDMLRFFCALAQQCFINEYIFACTDHENEQAGCLRARLVDALASGAPIPTLWLAAVAAFFPLASLPAANLLGERRWPAPVAQLVACHVREGQEEQQLQASVPRLTTITDGVSLAVKQQYEETPIHGG